MFRSIPNANIIEIDISITLLGETFIKYINDETQKT